MPRTNYKAKYESLKQQFNSNVERGVKEKEINEEALLGSIETQTQAIAVVNSELKTIKLMQLDLTASIIRGAKETDEYSDLDNICFDKIETDELRLLPNLPLGQALIDAKCIIDVLTERNAMLSEAYLDQRALLKQANSLTESQRAQLVTLKHQLNEVLYIGIDCTKEEEEAYGSSRFKPRSSATSRIPIPVRMKYKK